MKDAKAQGKKDYTLNMSQQLAEHKAKIGGAIKDGGMSDAAHVHLKHAEKHIKHAKQLIQGMKKEI
jgi:hypothetical protein